MAKQKGNVWDIPLRLFHWMLVASVIVAFVSMKAAGNLFVHEKAGLTAAALVVFRIIWGFVGSHHARFGNFMASPARAVAYIRTRFGGDRTYHPGHAPTGAWATLAILAVMAWMVIFGLLGEGDVLYRAPLADLIPGFSHTAHTLHHIGERLVMAVVVLHLLAMLVYWLALKINLVPAMWHGGTDKSLPAISKGKQVFGVVLLFGLIAAFQLFGLIGQADRWYG